MAIMVLPSGQSIVEEAEQTHVSYMREALTMGERALKSSETPVGCVLVYNNQIIGRGMNATNRTFNGTRHAEFIAVNEVLSALTPEEGAEDSQISCSVERVYGPEVLRECDLYVTVEPCIMCASLLRQFGIRKVFFGTSNEKFGGTGGVLDIQRCNGMALSSRETLDSRGSVQGKDDFEVSGGWLREEAIMLLRRFYVQENDRAPEPRGKKDRVLKLEVEPLPTPKAIGN